MTTPNQPPVYLLLISLANLLIIGPILLIKGINEDNLTIEIEATLVMILGVGLLTVYRSRLHYFQKHASKESN